MEVRRFFYSRRFLLKVDAAALTWDGAAVCARCDMPRSGWGYSSVAELVEFDRSLHKR